MIVDCVTCGRAIPANAAFCIYCAAPAGPAKQATIGAPATGATIQLDPNEYPVVTTPARRQPRSRRHKDPGMPLFLIGLVVICIFWNRLPWLISVLLLAGFAHFVKEASRGRQAQAVMKLLVLGGFGLIFIAQAFWPGVILLIIAIIAAQVANHRRGFGRQP